jgi:heat shock protein HtpX
MQNVYEQVARNKFQSGLIMVAFVIFVSLSVYLLTLIFDLGPDYLLFAGLFSIFGSLGSYFWGDKLILSLNGARPANRKDHFSLYTAVENLSLANQTPVPRIYVIDSPAPNAFATGRDPKNAVVCATTGLLEILNKSEIEAVVAHELSHIKNYDIRLMMIVAILIGSLSILTRNIYLSSGQKNRSRKDSSGLLALVGLFLLILSPLVAKLIQLAISRQREYLADASAAKLTRQPSALISALEKIQKNPSPLSSASPSSAHLYIQNPFKMNKTLSLFSTHPPLESRVAALQKML